MDRLERSETKGRNRDSPHNLRPSLFPVKSAGRRRAGEALLRLRKCTLDREALDSRASRGAETRAARGADRKAIADNLFSSANAAVHDAKLAGGNRYAIAGDEPASARAARHQQQK